VFFGIPGAVEDDSDSELTLQYGFGLVYVIGHNSVGIHFRHFDIKSSSNEFSIQDVEIGGDYVGLSYGWNF